MINLPEWKLTLCPPLYDTSSKSPTEMTAQVYAKTRELVTTFNEFSEGMNKAFQSFTEANIKDVQEFEEKITCLMNEYIESIDTKIHELNESISKRIEEGFIKYNEENEEIVIGGV